MLSEPSTISLLAAAPVNCEAVPTVDAALLRWITAPAAGAVLWTRFPWLGDGGPLRFNVRKAPTPRDSGVVNCTSPPAPGFSVRVLLVPVASARLGVVSMLTAFAPLLMV